MRIKLSTLFGLTSVACVGLVLARLSVQIPLVLAVMFAPATIAFLSRRTWVSHATILSLAILIGFQAWGMHNETFNAPLNPFSFFGFHVSPKASMQSDLATILIQSPYLMARHSREGVYVFMSWPVLFGSTVAYGITLQVVAWWLDRRGAATLRSQESDASESPT